MNWRQAQKELGLTTISEFFAISTELGLLTRIDSLGDRVWSEEQVKLMKQHLELKAEGTYKPGHSGGFPF